MAELVMEIRCMCGEWHKVDPLVTFQGAVIVACPSAPPTFMYGAWSDGYIARRFVADG